MGLRSNFRPVGLLSRIYGISGTILILYADVFVPILSKFIERLVLICTVVYLNLLAYLNSLSASASKIKALI